MSQIHYRSDIDGLRAIAIIPVVLFHLRCSGFNGGFVGVDVFFVISGFLITSIIYRDIKEQRFSFVKFYERRIRRLFPALFLVLTVSCIASYFLLMPEFFRPFAQSLVAATVFAANVLFWLKAGYFDAPAALKPLLHTWSLSVEEQFYVLFPITLLLLIRFVPRRVNIALAIFALVSFVSGAVLLSDYPDAVFYLPAFRAWELLLGALLALDAFPRPATQMQCHLLSLIGLALIAYSVTALSPGSTFPGINALYPCLGAALIIHAGSGEKPSIVGEILGWRPIVLIGLVSYSLYLWHWPLIVFTERYLVRNLLPVEQIAIFILSIVLAFLTWRYVERPFRGKSGLLTRKGLFKISAAYSSVLITMGLIGHFTHGLPQRLPPKIKAMAVINYNETLHSLHDSDVESHGGDMFALGGTGPGQLHFLEWGDSHAMALSTAFDSVGRKLGKHGELITRHGCPPFFQVERYDIPRACVAYNEAVKQFIERHKQIRKVFLVARWSMYAVGTRYGVEKGKPVFISPRGLSGNKETFKNGLERTVRFLAAHHITTYFVTDAPEIGWNVPSTLAGLEWHGRDINIAVPPDYAAYRKRQRVVYDILHQLDGLPFQTIDISPIFCSGKRCLVEKNGIPLYQDDDHLNKTGALLTSGLLAKALNQKDPPQHQSASISNQ